MTRNLVPTVIMDKNGRRTTVYKRAESTGQNYSGFPSPAPLEVKRGKRDVIPGIIEEIRELLLIDDDDTEYFTEKMEEDYTLDFLLRTESALKESPETASMIGLLLEAETKEVHINEALRFVPDIESRDLWASIRLVKTLHGYYPPLPEEDDYSKANAEVQASCAALLKVSLAIQASALSEEGAMRMVSVGDKNFDRVAILSDARLVALVVKEPQHADRIIQIVTERGSAEFGMIHAVLHTESIALSSGTL